MMTTFVDQGRPDVALRMSIIRQGDRIEVWEEVWNAESMRYEIRSRKFFTDKPALSEALRRRLAFIRTMLPTMRVVG